MNALGKKTERQRDRHVALQMSEIFVKAALLACDDMFGLTDAQSKQLVRAYSEIVDGYGECGGLPALNEELAARGIEVSFDGRDGTHASDEKKTPHQRGSGEWITIEGKNGSFCSHCNKGSAIRRKYCPECGAMMKKH